MFILDFEGEKNKAKLSYYQLLSLVSDRQAALFKLKKNIF